MLLFNSEVLYFDKKKKKKNYRSRNLSLKSTTFLEGFFDFKSG
jgi:hypothetical protein